MTKVERTATVSITKLEEAFGVDLLEFEVGKTYPMIKLFDKLKFGNGTPKLRRGPHQQKENVFEKQTKEKKRE